MTESLTTSDQIFIRKLTELVLANLENEVFGVKDLAEKSGVSLHSLNRRLDSINNKTANQFIREVRLTKALEMLKNESLTANEVAYKVGFNSPAYFNLCFSTFFGYPPGKVKKEDFESSAKNLFNNDTAKQKQKQHITNIIAFLLPWILLLCTLIIIGILLVFYIQDRRQSKVVAKTDKSIAVLPFINDSPDQENAYFINGIMEEALNNLQKIKAFRVLSRTSTDQYKDKSRPTIPEIAKKLNVNYIVEGSGQKYGNKFVLRVQLLVANNERQIWGKSYDREIQQTGDIISIQSEIAQSIAEELKANITPEEKQRINKIPTINLEAYDAYLKGEFYRKKMTKNDLETSMKYYKIALEKDPEYALAYSGIAFDWFESSEMGYLSPSEGISKAYAAIMTAQKLDSNLAEVHFLLGAYKLWTHWDWKGCESEYQKAFKFNPNNAEVPAIYSHLLNILGRPKEAMEQIEMALNLNPFDPMIKGLYSIDLLFMHRYKDAIAVSREALKIEPTNSPALTALMLSLHMTGRYDEALELWKTTYYISYPSFIHAFDQGYAKAGYIGALSLEADALVAQSKTSNVGPWDLANLYVCAGNKKRALDYLELGFKKHDQNLIYLTEPIFDCLHNETRYQALCRKMNLPIK